MVSVQLVRHPDDAVVHGKDLNRLIDATLGNDGAQRLNVGYGGAAIDPTTGLTTSTGNYSELIRSGVGLHTRWRNAADTANVGTITDTGLNFGNGDLGTLTVSGLASLLGNTVIGDAAGDTLTVGATGTFNALVTFTANVVIGNAAGDTLTVEATSTFNASVTMNANVVIGDAAGDTLTVTATSTFASPVTMNANVIIGDNVADTLVVTSTSSFLGPVTIGDNVADILTINSVTTILNNLIMSGVARLIQGDFSNATLGSRTLFQTSTPDGNSYLGTIPNGTGTASGLIVYNNSAAASGAWGALVLTSAVLRLSTNATTTTVKLGAGPTVHQIELGNATIGFLGATPVARPTVSGVLAGSPTLAQLTSVVRSILAAIDEASLGLVTDGTT